jgi:hypothetical protein
MEPIRNTELRNLDLIRGEPFSGCGSRRGSNTECGITEFNNRTSAGLLSGRSAGAAQRARSAGRGSNYRIRNHGITIELGLLDFLFYGKINLKFRYTVTCDLSVLLTSHSLTFHFAKYYAA